MSTPTIHNHDTTSTPPQAAKKGIIAGIGVFLACAIACSLPLIAAGGLAAGLGAFLAGGESVALGVVLLVAVLVGVALWLRRRRVATSTITRDQLVRLLQDDAATLIEALPVAHYDLEHLPGAINVPGELTASEAAWITPDPHRTVVVYCSGPSCGRSKVTADAFTRLGYTDVRVYPGGKADWFDAGLPLERAAALG